MEIQNLTQRISNNEEIIPQTRQENSDWLPPQTRLAAKALALLLFFSALMFSIPFIVFFGSKHYLLEHFHLELFQANAISVFLSVVSVNIIIGIYCYLAYKEPEYDDQGNLIQADSMGSKTQIELKED